MPGCDGIQITKCIRRELDRDTVILVSSAYDYLEIERMAQEAGADTFVTKPLFQSTLFDLFVSLWGKEIIRNEKTDQIHDFDGIRVLLVEDNATNRMDCRGSAEKRA
jgi:CheY-like chemotaxis protein